MPVFVFCQGPGVDVTWLTDAIGQFQTLINTLIPFLVALAVLYFMWGVVQFVAAAGDEGARAEGRSKMIWGIVGLFVLLSVWGLVELLAGFVGLGDGSTLDLPTANP